MKVSTILLLVLFSVACTAEHKNFTYELELKNYEKVIALCDAKSKRPLDLAGYSPRLSSDSYRIALLYFKLLTDYQCVEPELNQLLSRLELFPKIESPSTVNIDAKHVMWLIVDEKKRLKNAMIQFDAMADSEKVELWKIEAAKRPFNVTDALLLYTDILP